MFDLLKRYLKLADHNGMLIPILMYGSAWNWQRKDENKLNDVSVMGENKKGTLIRFGHVERMHK